jgi:hypothetical protein
MPAVRKGQSSWITEKRISRGWKLTVTPRLNEYEYGCGGQCDCFVLLLIILAIMIAIFVVYEIRLRNRGSHQTVSISQSISPAFLI